ncbi:MAG TPA: Rieske 2Fe-2S domain-containing protein [Acidimicrobiales bacterium]|nr:Rieske 2Fe-2S domain-containing protein [Acidimicrobiales bacterium]
MDTNTILTFALAGLVVLAALFFFTSSARRDRAAAVGALSKETRRRDRSDEVPDAIADGPARSGREVERAAVAEWRGGSEVVAADDAPPPEPIYLDEQALGVTRRQFLNRGVVGAFGLALSGFGGSMLAFLWPSGKGGFGSKVKAGSLDDIKAGIADGNGFFYFAEARTWFTEYPASAVKDAEKFYTGGVLEGMKQGINALYQKCPHLGCRVPSCESSQWFECPCHGSKYNQVGEKKAGPAPRGMDRFPVLIDGGQVIVDTGLVTQGPPIGTNTTGQEAEGPFCA